MKVGVTSDWHGYLPPEIPECDLLLVPGDIGLDEKFSYEPEVLMTERFAWLKAQPMPVVAVAGNHDFHPDILRTMPWTYLEDEVAEVAGLKIWGSPWSNPFGYGWAFNMTEEDQEELFKQIPDDVDVIISHGPPFGSCDEVFSRFMDPDSEKIHVGSEALLKRMHELPNLKLVACGHIHSEYGQQGMVVNGSLVNEKYEIANPVFVVEL